MKIMEVTIEENDCTVEMVTPPRKKMKQAQLPFQMVTPLGSSNTITNKKRKLESPSPVESKSPKQGKIADKRNMAKRAKSGDIEVIELGFTEDDDESEDQENSKAADRKESHEEESTADNKQGEKVVAKDGETPARKKKDYGMLDKFLKKAHSKEAKDDIQLLAMSDYESGSSKDSDDLTKSKNDCRTEQQTSGQDAESLDNKIINKDDAASSTKVTESSDEIKSLEDNDGENLDSEEEKKTESLVELKNSESDLSLQQKNSAISDDNDAKNGESDSDIGILSSDEDAESSNENGNRDKTLDESDGGKTPQDGRSKFIKDRKLTPKQVERRLQIAKKREERKQLRIEKERKREEERENRRKEKEEKRREKEEKERIEREQKRKEKEMREMKKQIEIEQKQKEKEAKEEERRKREEEKLEMERKKQKAASNFANFFVAKKQEAKAATEEDNVVKDQNFMPFEVKLDMRVAPITRRNLNDENKLTFEGLFNKGVSQNELYLNELKKNREGVGRSEKTWPWEAKDDVVVVDEHDSSSDSVAPLGGPIVEKHHPKFFLFAENRRPPFWGTWRKKSGEIRPRRPFAKDSKWFDYDVDSDDEWEEEEPGESIRGSDDERDDEGPEENNEYDVDNDFMVPHGYLSDEEAKADEEDGEDMSPETQKLKLKLLGEQFEAERKTKTSKIKPKVTGCIWQGLDNVYPENTALHVRQILDARRAWLSDSLPIALSATSTLESAVIPSGVTECGSPATPSARAKKKRVPAEAMPNLIRLVHGNINGRIFLVKEFIAYWERNKKTGDGQISKLSLSQKIKEIASWIACPEEGPMHTRSCWYVREDVRKEYDSLDVGLPNRWEYVLKPTRRSDVNVAESPERSDREKKRIPLITQFTKKITQEEKQKQLVGGKQPTNAATPSSVIKPPKRATLTSVPRGEQFNSPSIFRGFVNVNDSTKSPTTTTTTTTTMATATATATATKENGDSVKPDPNPAANLSKAERNHSNAIDTADGNAIDSETDSNCENKKSDYNDEKDSGSRGDAGLEPAAMDTGERGVITIE